MKKKKHNTLKRKNTTIRKKTQYDEEE